MTYLEMWAKLEIEVEVIKILFILISMVLIGIYYVMKGDK